MKSITSDGEPYFCSEPWSGILDISVEGNVMFCPCYLNLRLGNLNDSTMPEIWNGPILLEMREQFAAGELPARCDGQLCPVVLRETPAP